MVSKRRSGGLTVFFVLFIFLLYHYGTHSTMKSMRSNHEFLFFFLCCVIAALWCEHWSARQPRVCHAGCGAIWDRYLGPVSLVPCHTQTHTHIHTHSNLHARTHAQSHVHTYMHTHTHAHTLVFALACNHTRTHMHAQTDRQIVTRTDTHTYPHTHTLRYAHTQHRNRLRPTHQHSHTRTHIHTHSRTQTRTRAHTHTHAQAHPPHTIQERSTSWQRRTDNHSDRDVKHRSKATFFPPPPLSFKYQHNWGRGHIYRGRYMGRHTYLSVHPHTHLHRCICTHTSLYTCTHVC